MSVLIATGVLAAYVASLVLMAVEGDDVFFRSRGDAGHLRAVWALDGDEKPQRDDRRAARALRSRPPTATVLRDGVETTVATPTSWSATWSCCAPEKKFRSMARSRAGETTIDEALVTGESAAGRQRAGRSGHRRLDQSQRHDHDSRHQDRRGYRARPDRRPWFSGRNLESAGTAPGRQGRAISRHPGGRLRPDHLCGLESLRQRGS